MLTWDDASTGVDGVAEWCFSLQRSSGDVPGVLWLPADSRPSAPLVLLAHGGSGHKLGGRNRMLAQWFATECGIVSVAIDGPYHGDRVSEPLPPAEYQARIIAEGVDAVVDRMVGDWRAVIGELADLGFVDPAQVGLIGLSMGTRFGLPLAAAMGDSLRCAVLGKFGLGQTGLPAGLAMDDRIRVDARAVSAAVHFHVQWDDELFTRGGQLALFGLLGSRDKRLMVHSGRHGETQDAAVEAWCAFIAAELRT
ncbi:dienelactone hydrolase family protein [Solicola gregarius]|uniref:Dienelactone hydrolase domain-containing protein n=1 Tax=Solicola gregarius TaxID=2908642 RepID=A0AA46TKE7_9ACTN|nr:hypothetical protein [Solicola gregarius]UYM06954.1 hypothetical protein L0C25_07720 [Solicola gregarius]